MKTSSANYAHDMLIISYVSHSDTILFWEGKMAFCKVQSSAIMCTQLPVASRNFLCQKLGEELRIQKLEGLHLPLGSLSLLRERAV